MTIASAPVAAPRTTYRPVFASGQFRLLLAGQIAYIIGYGFELLGLSVLIYARTRSAFLAALAFGMGWAPQIAGGLLLTSIADRLPPRAVITTGLLIRALPGLVIGLLPGLPVPVILALIAAAATTSPVYSAAIARLVPDILTGDTYVLGRSVLNLTSSGGQIFSLGIGGAILAVLSARGLMLAAAGTLIASAAIRFGLRPPAAGARAAGARLAMRGGLRDTVRATLAGNGRLFRDPRVRGLLLVWWLPAWLGTSAESLVVPYTGALGKTAAAVGPLLAAVPVGMMLGDFVIGRFCPPPVRQRLVFPLVLLVGAPLLLFLVRPPVPAACAVLLLSGCGHAYNLGIQQPFLDSVPADLRGQSFGLNQTGLMGGQGLCPAAAGALAVLLGPAAAMAVCGGAIVAAAVVLHPRLTPSTPRAPRR